MKELKQKEFDRKFDGWFRREAGLPELKRKRNRTRKNKSWNKGRWHGGRRWKSKPLCSKKKAYEVEVSKLIAYMNRLSDAKITVDDFDLEDVALMCANKDAKFDGTTFLGDTGASTHMVGSDEGLYDCKDIDEPVVVGDGKGRAAGE